MKNYKERFDKRFVANLPMSGIHLKDSTGNILDYSEIIIGEIKDFIEQIISERDKEVIQECGKVAYPGEDAFYVKLADVKKILQTLNK